MNNNNNFKVSIMYLIKTKLPKLLILIIIVMKLVIINNQNNKINKTYKNLIPNFLLALIKFQKIIKIIIIMKWKIIIIMKWIIIVIS